MDLSLVNILARESELEHPLVVCLVSAIPPFSVIRSAHARLF